MPELTRIRAREGLCVFLAFLALYLSLRSQYYTGDTLYYAHQVDTWFREQRKIHMFYHFAHVLVVPAAVGFRRVLEPLFGLDSLASMGVMAAFFAAGTVAFLYQSARHAGVSRGHALLLASLLGFSFGFLDYGTVGEDRIQGVFLLTAFLYTFLRIHSRWEETGRAPNGYAGLLTGLLLGLAVAMHLSNGILLPFFCLAAPFVFGCGILRTAYPWTSLLAAVLVLVPSYLLVAFGNDVAMGSLWELPRQMLSYHSTDQPYFTHSLAPAALSTQTLYSAIGIFTAFYYMPEVYLRTAFAFTPWHARLLLGGSFFLFVLTFAGVVLSARRPRKLDAALWVLLGFWALHSFFFEAISRADWFPVLVIAFFLFARAWAGASPRAVNTEARRRVLAWARIYLPVFLGSLLLVNLPHMVEFHRQKSPYVKFIEFCADALPRESLLVLGNSMAVTHFDYFRDRYDYPFSVVTFYDVMGVHPAIFARLKPPTHEIREIDSALAEGRPVFVTRRALEIPAEMYRYLEMEYPPETAEKFLDRYATAPFLKHPFTDIYRVSLRAPVTDP